MGKCYHHFRGTPLCHCVCVCVCVKCAGHQIPGCACFFPPLILFQGQEFCSKTHNSSLSKRLPALPSSLFIRTTIILPHFKHCYYSLFVFEECRLKIHHCTGSLWGHILFKTYYTTSSGVSHVMLNTFSLKLSCSARVEAASISMASQQPWSHTRHPLLTSLRS